MRRHFILFISLIFLIPVAKAQSVKTGVFTLNELAKAAPDENNEKIYMPPNLSVHIDFIDEDGKEILSALESAKVKLSIKNSGGDANGVKISLTPEKNYKGISLGSNSVLTNIPSNRTVEVEFPIQAGVDLQTSRDTRFNIKIFEPLGYDIEAVLNLATIEYMKPRLILNGITSIVDAGVGLMARNGNPDGKIQAGDVANVSLLLQNVGVGNAEEVTYSITSKDPNVLLYTSKGPVSSLTGSLQDILSGESAELSFRVSPTNRYSNAGEYLPVYLTLKEKMGLGDLVSKNIQIPFDAAPIKPELVSVDGDFDRVIASVGKTTVTSSDNRVNSLSQSQRTRDIMQAPKGSPLYENAVAIVIGVENYEDVNIPTAPYSARDARVISEYFKVSMGVGQVITLTDNEVTDTKMKTTFDARKGSLSKKVKPGVTDVFVYYSGHGVPMETEDSGRDVFLIPHNVTKDWISDLGFSLNKMYAELASLNARSVTVILDACFSGGSRPSSKYKSESVANQKLVIYDTSDMEQPWLDNSNFRVFTSSRSDQASYGRDLSESGLFTYYLATGLQGDADVNADGSVSMTELVEYVTSNVAEESDGSQIPQFFGSKDDFILEKIK